MSYHTTYVIPCHITWWIRQARLKGAALTDRSCSFHSTLPVALPCSKQTKHAVRIEPQMEPVGLLSLHMACLISRCSYCGMARQKQLLMCEDMREYAAP